MNTDEDYEKGVEEIWAVFDDDKSGKLDKEQATEFLRHAIKSITGEPAGDYQIQRDFIKMDLDKSGDIDKDEAIKYLKGVKAG